MYLDLLCLYGCFLCLFENIVYTGIPTFAGKQKLSIYLREKMTWIFPKYL